MVLLCAWTPPSAGEQGAAFSAHNLAALNVIQSGNTGISLQIGLNRTVHEGSLANAK